MQLKDVSVHKLVKHKAMEQKKAMKALVEAQVELYGRISRTYDNLRKVGAFKLTRAFITTTINFLAK